MTNPTTPEGTPELAALREAIRAYGDARADVHHGRGTLKAIDRAWDQVLAFGGIPPMDQRATHAAIQEAIESSLQDSGYTGSNRLSRACHAAASAVLAALSATKQTTDHEAER